MRGEGVIKSEHFMDIISGSSLREILAGRPALILRLAVPVTWTDGRTDADPGRPSANLYPVLIMTMSFLSLSHNLSLLSLWL